MKFFDLFKKALKEEKLPQNKKGILLLDIDDTLSKSDPNMMHIYRKLPTDKNEVALTSAEYAKENVTPDSKKYYDYRDFTDPKKIYVSIVKASPLINNLKAVDAFYNGGYDIGVLTARGCEDAVAKGIKKFLKIKDSNGNLINPNINRDNIHAINDASKNYPGNTDFEKKQNVLKDYASKYDYVYFIDDDAKNLTAAKALKKDPDIGSKLRTIDAKKNMKHPITEMAMKDVNQEMINYLNKGDYDATLQLYFNAVKNQGAYAGLKDAKAALKKVITFGIARTFGALEKKGTTKPGSTSALKAYGLDNLDELASEVEYEGNPEYVAPTKKAANIERKRLVADTKEELLGLLDKVKKEGWKCNDEAPREGSTKAKPHFFYVYISRPKATEINEEIITEMAMKDVSQDMINDINNKDYISALRKYFDKVKTQKSYADKSDAKAAFQHLKSYGITKTFDALVKKGTVPEGTTAALKKAANEHEDEIIGNVSYEAKEAKPKEEKKVASSFENPELKKIEARINKYIDREKEIKDYAFTSKSITPFVVNTKLNGKSGIKLGSDKPKLTDDGSILLSKTERYINPMLKFRKNFIPDFVQKKADKDMSSSDKHNLELAERMGQEYVEATKNRIYALYMSNVLNNIIEAFKEARMESGDDAILAAFKEDAAYSDFVKIDKWAKNRRMDIDKEAAESANRNKTSSANISKEVYKVKSELVTFVNSMAKANANNSFGDFVASNPANLSIILTALETNKDGISSAVDIKDFAKKYDGNFTTELVPVLKDRYAKRFEENFEPNADSMYKSLSSKFNALVIARNSASEEDKATIDRKLDKYAEPIIDVFLDKIAGLDLIVHNANSGLLDDADTAAKRYEAIKAKIAKQLPNTKKAKATFDAKSDKYKQYYDPEGDEVEKKQDAISMRKAVESKISSMTEKLLQNKMQIVLINSRLHRYNNEEIKELYDALNNSEDAFFDKLNTDKFKSRRSDSV